MFGTPMKFVSRVHTKLTKLKQNRNSVFCNIYETFLQLSRAPSPVGKDQKVSVLLQVLGTGYLSQRSVDSTETKHKQSMLRCEGAPVCCDMYGHFV
jgi:hypothetical protein